MKKSILLIAIVASISSCKKVQTCTCTYAGGGFNSTETVEVWGQTKRQAKRGTCASYKSTSTKGVVTIVNCTVN